MFIDGFTLKVKLIWFLLFLVVQIMAKIFGNRLLSVRASTIEIG